MKALLVSTLLLISCCLRAADVIGTNSMILLSTSALYSGHVNFRPGDGEVVIDVNPPRFSWYYSPVPTNNAGDVKPKKFLFLVSTNSDCLDGFVVSVTNFSNSYNYLSPLDTNYTYYWKVGYINPASSISSNWTLQADSWAESPFAWSQVRSFTISPNAVSWDRSMLADESYITGKVAHPHLLWQSTNYAALTNYIITRGSPWTGYILKSATNTMTNAWWPDKVPTTTNYGSVRVDTWAAQCENVFFVRGVLKTSDYDSSKDALVTLARWFTTNYTSGLTPATTDWVIDGNPHKVYRALATGYDYIYDLMSAPERAEVLNALELRAKHILYSYFYHWLGGDRDTNGLYPGGFEVNFGSFFKKNGSHPIDNVSFSIPGLLSAFGDSTYCREAFDMWMNWSLGVGYNWGQVDGTANGQGRPYGMSHNLGNNFYSAMNTLTADTIFREANLGRNPYWKGAVDWYSAWWPVSMHTFHEDWGDTSPPQSIYLGNNTFGDISALVGSGYGYQHYAKIWPLLNSTTQRRGIYNIVFPYYTTAPTQTNSPMICFRPSGGWYIEGGDSFNKTECFSNCVGICWQVRPSGSWNEHDCFSDGSYQLWAYGANLTDSSGGKSSYGKHTMAHYTALIDGYGTCQPQPAPIWDYYSKFIAFTNTADYTYVSADLTRAYPTVPFHQGGGWLYPYNSAVYENAPLSKLTKAQRHILFMHKKYFVIFDDLVTSSPAVFSTVYHIQEPTLTNLSGASFDYTATNILNPASPVVRVFVRQIVDAGLLTVTNAVGIPYVAINPITGENKYSSTYGSPRANAIWTTSSSSVTNFHFLTIIYPFLDGGAEPTITRLDNYTVQVENGDTDVISFDPDTVEAATLIVDAPAIGGTVITNPPVVPAPVPLFTGTPLSGTAPLSVSFTDDSTGIPTSWAWDFDGDGVIDSTSQNPSFIYASSGTYSVTLTTSNSGGGNSLTKTDYIVVNNTPLSPLANFDADVSSGTVPLTVHFTDESISATSWAWDFDNSGTVDSTTQNPTHIYTISGDYSVKLSINTGASELTKTNYISASNPFVPPTNMVISVGPVTVKQISGK